LSGWWLSPCPYGAAAGAFKVEYFINGWKLYVLKQLFISLQSILVYLQTLNSQKQPAAPIDTAGCLMT